jgi:hypothetical protein
MFCAKMAKKFNNSHTVVLKGREITMRDLQATVSNSQALIMHRLVHCVAHKQFVMRPNYCDTPFVGITRQESAGDLDICFLNGNKRKISRVTVCMIFTELLQDGFVMYRHDHSTLISYTVYERNLIHRITERPSIKVDGA